MTGNGRGRRGSLLDRGVTGDTVHRVKTISIKQLHARTGHWVRTARTSPVIVTDRGEEVAVLNSRDHADSPRPTFSLAARKPRPRVPGDSTAAISEDRNAR
jgi:prevent-host-death family protein